MEFAFFILVCLMAAVPLVSAIPAIWSGEIRTVRLIGAGSVRHDRSERPIRYGCALLVHLYFGAIFSAGAIALAPAVPVDQWLLGVSLACGTASLVLSWRLGRARVGSAARLMQATLRALQEVPRPDQSYRSSGAARASALGPLLMRFMRVELLKCDLSALLALVAIALALASLPLALSAWHWLVALAAVAVGGFGAVRWRHLRQAITRAVDQTAVSAAQRGLPEW